MNEYQIPDIQLENQGRAAKNLIDAYNRVDEVNDESKIIEAKMTTNSDSVLLAIGRLEGKVDGINQRLDFTNGRIGKLETKKDEFEKRIDTQDGVIKGVKSTFTLFNIIWGAVIAFGGLLIAGISLYLKFK